MPASLDHVITSGTFSLDGQDFDVDNNVWILGDDREVVVIDAAHDARKIAEAIRGPGATGRSFSSYEVILESIEKRLFGLPASTVVHTGHGDSTSIGTEAPSLAEWRSKLETEG